MKEVGRSMGEIQLVSDEIRHGSVRLTRVARWIAPVDGEHYWHIPRSAELLENGVRRGSWARSRHDETVCARLWCGQLRWVSMSDFHGAPFADALRCGTCEGRASGFERRDGLVFAPRSPFDAPKFCPAFLTNGEKECPFCGSKGRWRRSYCHYDQTQHRPGALLANATPCPRHGWKWVRRQSAGLVCLGGAWGNNCGFVLMKAAA